MNKLTKIINNTAVINLIRKVSFSFYSLVAREPKYKLLYRPYVFWAKIKRQKLGERADECEVFSTTDLVIDGFQGSANSFVTEAFMQSQTKPVNVAHHLHSPVQIIAAVRQQVPVWLVIREPKGAVISLTSRWPHISVTQGLKSYIGFYSKLQQVAPYCVVSTFEQNTQRLDEVIHKINHRFGTDFNLADVPHIIEQLKLKHSNPEELAKRQPLKQAKKKEFASAPNERLLSQAEEIYQTFERLAQHTYTVSKN